MSEKRPQLTHSLSPEEAIISMKNQLTIIEDNASEGRKLIQNQLYNMIVKISEAFKKQGTEKAELEEEYDRVIRICLEHNIDIKPDKKFKNRKERRAQQKESDPGITKIPESL